jgi:ribosome biogenesis protein SSF1/2
MPRVGGRRKKTRTHVEPAPGAPLEKVPRSFVLRRGKVDSTVGELVQDMRRLMMPHTADRLRERKVNTLKDFVHIAGPLGVTHMMVFAQSAAHVSLRIARMPRGPTLNFRVDTYTLARQVKAAQKRPVDLSRAFLHPPLVVLHNFSAATAGAGGGDASVGSGAGGSAGVSLGDALNLVQTTFRNMFPSINPATMKLADCRRVVLVHYHRERRQVEVRHYVVRAVPVGVSKGVRKASSNRVPDLSRLEDVSQFVLSGGRTGAPGSASESEVEDEASRVVLPQDFAGRGNVRSQASAIKLAEVGPRLTLSLLKVEQDVCGGEVLYHSIVSKTPSQVAALRKAAAAKEQERAQRRGQQEANVARKKADADAKKAAKKERKRVRLEEQQAAAEAEAAESAGRPAPARAAHADDDEDEEEHEGSVSGGDDDEADADAEVSDGDDLTDSSDSEEEPAAARSGRTAGGAGLAKTRPASSRGGRASASDVDMAGDSEESEEEADDEPLRDEDELSDGEDDEVANGSAEPGAARQPGRADAPAVDDSDSDSGSSSGSDADDAAPKAGAAIGSLQAGGNAAGGASRVTGSKRKRGEFGKAGARLATFATMDPKTAAKTAAPKVAPAGKAGKAAMKTAPSNAAASAAAAGVAGAVAATAATAGREGRQSASGSGAVAANQPRKGRK